MFLKSTEKRVTPRIFLELFWRKMRKKNRMKMVPKEDVKHRHISETSLTFVKKNFKCKENVFNISVSLRECVRKLSITGGQRFKRCNYCKGKYLSTKCSCKKMRFCVTRIVMTHNTLSCSNK